MALVEFGERLQTFKPPYFKFPENPRTIQIGGYPAYEYIAPKQLTKLIDAFSQFTDLNLFDALCVNRMGGQFFASELLKRKLPNGPMIIDIEYHEDGRVLIAVPKFLRGERIGVIDDVLDKFITGGMIQSDAPMSTLLYLTKKRDVTPAASLHNCFWASEVDNQWLLGGGMNGELKGDGLPENWGRSFGGIAAKIQ